MIHDLIALFRRWWRTTTTDKRHNCPECGRQIGYLEFHDMFSTYRPCGCEIKDS